jgi:hypothetical protein
MMKFKYFILLLFIICAGCQKEKQPDPPIIEPGSYYPVYPNSWWKYLVNDSVIKWDTTSDDYLLHSYLIHENPEKYSDPVRVPFLNGNPIYCYKFVDTIGYPDNYYGLHELWPILSEEVGYSFWISWFDTRYAQLNQRATVESKTFNGTDSVLHLVSGWTNVYVDYYVYPEKRYRTFVKGIGLTSDILVDTVTSDTLSRKILIDYYVNHPF